MSWKALYNDGTVIDKNGLSAELLRDKNSLVSQKQPKLRSMEWMEWIEMKVTDSPKHLHHIMLTPKLLKRTESKHGRTM